MRIRSVKPEFWSDSDLAKTTPEARLLAIGLLNFADDEGYFQADAALIRSAVFPFDDDSMITRRCLVELSSIWMTIRQTKKGPIGQVTNFKKHQRIDRPKPSALKEYYEEAEDQPGLPGLIGDESSNDRRDIATNRPQERKGMEGKGKEGIYGGEPQHHENRKFQKPSAEEVEAYAKSIGYSLKGRRFCDYYEKQGWKLSNGLPLKDWKAAVRTWRDRDAGNGALSKKGGDPYAM